MDYYRKKFRGTVSIVQEYKGLKENIRSVSLCVWKTVSAGENAIQRDRQTRPTEMQIYHLFRGSRFWKKLELFL